MADSDGSKKLLTANTLQLDDRPHTLTSTGPGGAPTSPGPTLTTSSLSPLMHWTIGYFRKRGWTISEDGRVRAGGLSVEAAYLRLEVDYASAHSDENYLPQAADFRKALYLESEERLAAHRQALMSRMKCDKEDVSPAVTLLKAFRNNPSPADVAMFLHILTNIKKSLFGITTDLAVFWVLQGKAGSGKTELLLRLLSPFGKRLVWWDQSLRDVCDERNTPQLGSTVATTVPEMKDATRTDIIRLKSVIDARVLSYRPLYTNIRETVERTTNFLGTSNFPLIELISDSSGMRKFYEQKSDDRFDRDAINRITGDQSLALWKGLNENSGNKYFQDGAKEIAAEQAKLVVLDPVDQFLQDNGLVPAKSLTQENTCWVRNDLLWKKFREWSETTGVGRTYDNSFLSRKLQGRMPCLPRTRLKCGARKPLHRFVLNDEIQKYLPDALYDDAFTKIDDEGPGF
jgi:hypothetical protein